MNNTATTTETRELNATETLLRLITGDPSASPEEALFAYIDEEFEKMRGRTTDRITHTSGPGRSLVERTQQPARSVRASLLPGRVLWRVVYQRRLDPSKRWNSPVNRGLLADGWTIAAGVADSMEEATKIGRAEAARLAKERAKSEK